MLIILASAWNLEPRQQLASTVASELSCTTTLAEKVLSADVIVAGRVAIVVGQPNGRARVIIQPDHIYQGADAAPTLVLQALDAAASAGQPRTTTLHFSSADPAYLFYLHRAQDGTYTTSTCDGTRLLGEGPTAAEQALFKAVPAS